MDRKEDKAALLYEPYDFGRDEGNPSESLQSTQRLKCLIRKTLFDLRL